MGRKDGAAVGGQRAQTSDAELSPGELREGSQPRSAPLPRPSLQNIPTLGSVAVTMALHGCDEVAVAGFGYDMSTPNAPLHYYETVRMAAIKEVRGWAGRGQSPRWARGRAVPARRTALAVPPPPVLNGW